MKNLNITVLFFLIIALSCVFIICTPSKVEQNPKTEFEQEKDLGLKAQEAERFCLDNGMNQDFCILIDMDKHSGKNRFYVWNFRDQSPIAEYLVAHGCGNNPWSLDDSRTNPKFSNTEDSHLSSLGKYKIGDRGWSNWGVNINYRLHGLDETNSNSNKRDIVFHSWEEIADAEVYPAGTPEGWGCPAISDKAFLAVDKLLKHKTKPTLMWIYK
jgi:hypothetical protein